MSVRSAVSFRDVPTGNENIEQVLTNGNNANGKSIKGVGDITADTFNGSVIDLNSVLIQGRNGGGQDITNINNLEVQTINGFSTNRNSFGEFIAQHTISATANTDFIIPLTTAINLTAGGYLATVKINLTANNAGSYYIYLYLDADLLTSAYISSVSVVSGISLIIPSFPLSVPAEGGSLTIKGRVNTTGSVVIAGFGDSYIFCGEIFKGVNPPPNPTPIVGELVWTAQPNSGNLYWQSVASSTDGVKLVGGVGKTIYTSVDSGVNWTQRFTSLSSGGGFSVASSADGVKLVACGSQNDDYIYTSIDSGISWVARQKSPAQDNNWLCCASSADGVKLIVGGFEKVWTSVDSGATWLNSKVVTQQSITGVAITSDGSSFVCCIYTQILKGSFTDSTINTFSVYIDTTNNFSGVAVSSDRNIIYASGLNGIIKSTDAGATWNTILSTIGTYTVYYKLFCSSDGNRLITYNISYNQDTPTSTSYIVVSDDAGATFSQQTNLGNRGWIAITISPDGNKFIAGVYNGQIYTGEYV